MASKESKTATGSGGGPSARSSIIIITLTITWKANGVFFHQDSNQLLFFVREEAFSILNIIFLIPFIYIYIYNLNVKLNT
jgi:hypothetical protein